MTTFDFTLFKEIKYLLIVLNMNICAVLLIIKEFSKDLFAFKIIKMIMLKVCKCMPLLNLIIFTIECNYKRNIIT